MTAHPSSDEGFSNFLRHWRQSRRLSQLELSMLANTSTRHISFLEKGRSKPSRDMVLKLGTAMNVTPADINAGLTAAGFAKAYPKANLDDASVAVLNDAVQTLLRNHMPWPAVACNQSWDVIAANPAATHLFEASGLNATNNLIKALLEADAPDSAIVNWPELAQLILRRIDVELHQSPQDVSLKHMRTQLAEHPRLQSACLTGTETLSVVVPIRIRINETELSMISMIAQFGAVQELTYAGIQVEMYFPSDELTEAYFTQLTH